MQPFYIAPEVLKGNYDEKCDVWSAGVILYIILCGYPPFYGETNKEILEQVKKGKLDFSGPEWKEKSPDVLDLIRKMVCEADCRYTAQQVLAHKWMLAGQEGIGETSAQYLKKVYAGLLKLSNASKFQQMALIYLARQMNENEIMTVQAAFNHIEKYALGQISPEEFIETGRSLGLEEAALKATFDKLDIFERRALTYYQFCSACLSAEGLLTEDKLKAVFKVWDLDKDGRISAEDFVAFLGNEFPQYRETKFFGQVVEEVKAIPSLDLQKFLSLVTMA